MNLADACLKCTLCLSACPVVRADPDFPGPKALGPEWHRRRLEGDDRPLEHVDDCTFCQLCEAACPVGIPIAHLIAEQKASAPLPIRRRLRDAVLTRPHFVARWPKLANAPAPVARLLDLSPGAERPKPRGRRSKAFPGPATGPRVGLFVDCFDYGYDQEVVSRATELLTVWGFQVVPVPHGALCCGAAAYASGRVEQARRSAKTLARRLQSEAAGIDTLVTLNATCDGTIRDEWPTFLDAPAFAGQVVPFHEFALAHAPAAFWEEVASVGEAGPTVVHTTCRGKVARGDGGLLELALRAGVKASPLDLACCGAAGSYAFKAEHEETARTMGARALAFGASAIWVDSGTCALHLAQMTGIPARHPAVWLWQRWQAAKHRSTVSGGGGQSS